MKLPITFVCAVAIHAAAAVGVAAFGHARGTNLNSDVFGRTIEVDEALAAPVVHEDEVAPVARASVEKQSSHGTPRAAAVATHAIAAPADSVAAVPTETPDSRPPEPVRFKMTMSAQQGGAPGVHASATAAAGKAEEEVAVEADVSERARQVGGVPPRYPSEALAQGVELAAPLPFEIVVDAAGRVVSTRALKHAGYGFDAAAVEALRTYRFTPAKRNGRAVAVRMKWTVDFHFD